MTKTGRKQILAFALPLGAMLVVAAAASAIQVTWPPRLSATVGATVSPRQLPKNEYRPIRWHVFGKVRTTDDSHPSALREVVADTDKDVKINVEGYPRCKAGLLESLTSKGALKTCRDALLGEGKEHVEVASSAGPPVVIRSRMLVFNGGARDGAVRLLIHAFIAKPVASASVAVVDIQEEGGGLHTTSKIPVIADGMGSVLDFDFEVGRVYDHDGARVGYLEARCPDEVFELMTGLLFRNEAHTPGAAASTVIKGALDVPCTSGS